MMRSKHYSHKYKNEYNEIVLQRHQRIPVYKNYCVGDKVYMWGILKAVVWRGDEKHVYLIFEDDFSSGIIDKEYFDLQIKRR